MLRLTPLRRRIPLRFPPPLRSYATHAPPPPPATDLDRLLPDSIFTHPSPLTRSLARSTVSVVLQQLRSGLDATTRQRAADAQQEADQAVRKTLQDAGLSAETLLQFTVEFVKSSRDPRRLPIASRLFVVAFGIDPMSLADPTSPTETTAAQKSQLSSQPLAGPNAWGVNAAGYNWASMVLSGQASPPPGLHLLQRGTDEARELIKDQQAAAIRVYATLAMREDAQGMLGMGRILLASMRRTESAGGSSSKDASMDDKAKAKREQEMTTSRKRIVSLWTRAGEKGVADAWFELGLLSLGSQGDNSEASKTAAKSAEGYFEKGATAGSSQCHHALGVMHTQRAMQSSPASSSPERQASLDKSMNHFRQAAELGDGQSAHHVAMRFLLREEMIEETSLGSEGDGRSPQDVRQQAIGRHSSLWGVEPDDQQARHWFSKAAEAGFMPAMMNLAGMLFEERGGQELKQTAQSQPVTEDAKAARLRDLRKAESLYAKVAAQASVLSQQQQQQQTSASSGSPADSSADMTAEMASFAQQALGTVQEAIKELVAK